MNMVRSYGTFVGQHLIVFHTANHISYGLHDILLVQTRFPFILISILLYCFMLWQILMNVITVQSRSSYICLFVLIT